MSEISVEEQIRVIESLMFVVEGHDWEGSSMLLEQEGKEGILLRNDCPGAARDRINLASETTKINEKKLRIDQGVYTMRLDAARKRGDSEMIASLEIKLKEVSDARRRNLQNMDKLESIASDYAVKYKPGDDKWEQRSHAIFLNQQMMKMQDRLKREEEAEFPNPDTLEKLQRRMERVGKAREESEKWLSDNDGAWNSAFKQGSVGSSSSDIKSAVKAKVKEMEDEEKKQEAEAEVEAGGTVAAEPATSGSTGAAPAPNAKAAEPEPQKELGFSTASPDRRRAAGPGTVWKTPTGYGAKKKSGKAGSLEGTKYFTGSDAEQRAQAHSQRTDSSTTPANTAPSTPANTAPAAKAVATPAKTAPAAKAVATPKTTAVKKKKAKSGAGPLAISKKPAVKKKQTAPRKIKKPSTLKAGDLVHSIVGKYLAEATYKRSGLGKWFGQSADDTPGWDRYNTKGDRIGKCGDAEEGESYAACLSPEKARKLGEKGIASFVRRKRAAQKEAGMAKKGEGKEGGGDEPVRVSTGVDKVDEGWSQEYKDSIDCGNPKGFSQRAHCEGREKSMSEEASMKIVESVDFEKFRAHWKKAPSSYDFKMSTLEGQRAYWNAYFKHFEEKYGEIPAKVKKAMQEAGFKSNPSITYEGKKFALRTGMDEMDLLYHVFNTNEEIEESMNEGKEVSTDELKSAVQELIALIKKHEKLAYEARKAGNTKEYNRQRGIVAEFSAEIKTVQDIIKRTLKSGKTTLTITEEEDDTEGKTLNKPFRTPGEEKKFAVYVRNDNGNVVKVRFGDPNMEIKRDDPDRLKAFRSRHSCDDDPGPKWKARYWSCQMWRSDKSVDEIISEAAENEPTNPELWEKIQDLVAGRTSSMQHGGETIEGPNEGKGFDVHPSAYSNAWAAKLYGRLGGGWKSVSEESMKKLVHSVVSKTLSEGAKEAVKK